MLILDQGIVTRKRRGRRGRGKETRGEIMKPKEKAAMHMVGNGKRKIFPETSGVGHTVSAGAEAAFCWLCLLPTITTRLPQPPHGHSYKPAFILVIFGLLKAKPSCTWPM